MAIAKSIETSIKGGGVVSNIPELQAWLKEYVKVRNVTVYESVLDKMRNIAFKAWKHTYRADPSNIKSELTNLPITKETGDINRKNTKFVGLYKLMNWERKRKGLIPLGGSRPKIKGKKKYLVRENKPKTKYMQGAYKGFLKARAQSARWLALGWRASLASLGVSKTRGQDWGGGEEATLQRIIKQGGAGSKVVKFKPGNTEFSIYNGLGMFDARNKKPYPMRSDSDIARARAVQQAGLTIAVQEEIKNMAAEIAKRTSDDWYGKKVKVKAV